MPLASELETYPFELKICLHLLARRRTLSNEESALKGTIPDPELQRPSRNSEMVESQQIVDLWRRARERGGAVYLATVVHTVRMHELSLEVHVPEAAGRFSIKRR